MTFLEVLNVTFNETSTNTFGNVTCVMKKENILRIQIVCLRHTHQKLDLIIEKSNSFQLKVIVFVKLCYELIWMIFPIYLSQYKNILLEKNYYMLNYEITGQQNSTKLQVSG